MGKEARGSGGGATWATEREAPPPPRLTLGSGDRTELLEHPVPLCPVSRQAQGHLWWGRPRAHPGLSLTGHRLRAHLCALALLIHQERAAPTLQVASTWAGDPHTRPGRPRPRAARCHQEAGAWA